MMGAEIIQTAIMAVCLFRITTNYASLEWNQVIKEPVLVREVVTNKMDHLL